MAKISKEQAKKILSNTSPEKSFWVNKGPVIRNLIELATSLKKLTPEQFAYHVNSTKNDFVKWISEVIGDSELAKKLGQIKTKEDFGRAVSERLKSLYRLLK